MGRVKDGPSRGRSARMGRRWRRDAPPWLQPGFTARPATLSEEILIALVLLIVLAVLVGVPIILVVLLIRTSRLRELVRRVERLETELARSRALGGQRPAEAAAQPAAIEPSRPGIVAPAAMALEAEIVAMPAPARSEGLSWEMFIGRRALGWVAVIVLLFAAGFFIRYAFENRWLGPIGQVSLGLAGGVALVAAGWQQHRRGAAIWARMLTAGGIVLLYLATFSSSGFYHLIGQREAGLFLFIVVAESALLALAYDSWAIALMAIVGGLLTPVLMHSTQDQYRSLFTYLAVLNAGAVGLLLRRPWPAVGTVALMGTQGLFWTWHAVNYHPEKLAWALGFQVVVYLLYLGHILLLNFFRKRGATWEDAVRVLLTALLWFTAAYVLLRDDYRHWLGSLAVLMAAVYAAVARAALATATARLLWPSLAASAGFLALAFPLEASAPWIALGWAAEAAVLWWFGLCVQAWPLRLIAAAVAILAVGHVLVGVPAVAGPPPILVFNRFALPALCAAGCLLASLAAGSGRLRHVAPGERGVAGAAVVVCLLLLLWIESVDLVRFFHARSAPVRLTQMSLSTWWAVYATVLLLAGFGLQRSLLRWTALCLYLLTVGKVFLFDMSGLDQIYRIVAFFVLAVLLGLAAWVYQRVQPERIRMTAVEES